MTLGNTVIEAGVIVLNQLRVDKRARIGMRRLVVSADISIAYVEFEEAYSVKIALFLSGSEIAGQTVAVSSCGTVYVDPSPYLTDHEEAENGSNIAATHSDKFISTPGEAVTVVQKVVQTMISQGYVLSKDALSKAKAFDESHQVSSTAAAKVSEFSKRIGLTDKIHSGVEAVKSVDERYRVTEVTKSVATYTGKTAAAAASAVVNSSYFAQGALWVSDVLDRAAKAAADLGTRGVQK
ncbi:binding partner of ACD11 1-like isoform X2 [Andrographis paniculata]|uniref:binding partner of ACD11 1-like isoform X2 n=1 Tax=Andrographis paniculata TaxID=175694 RepID=UPI0021E7DC2F|nr:binding partner of ACD11 1-like isoform X2 [Andrographis paniculata]